MKNQYTHYYNEQIKASMMGGAAAGVL